MTKRAAVMGFGVFVLLTLASLAQPQQGSWRTEHHDSLLVAPNATEVKYVYVKDSDWSQVTYIVEEPYPAVDVLHFISEDLKQKGWKPQYGPVDVNQWTDHATQYLWAATWINENYDTVGYMLYYMRDKGDRDDHHLHTLHVEANYVDGIAIRQRIARLKAEDARVATQEKFHSQVVRYRYGVAIVAYLAVLGTPLILVFRKSHFTVFYSGPYAWLTRINLLLFGTLTTPLLWFGAALISGVAGKELSLLTIVVGWVVTAMFAKVGYLVCGVVFLVAMGILRAEKIPKMVKIVHCALAAATLVFFALCIRFFSEPYHW
jgi:hypothetical protein